MNCFDFDKTIYRNDCSIRFYFFCLHRHFFMVFHLISVLCLLIANKLRIINTKKFKEKFFSFLKRIKNVEHLVRKFWDKEIVNVNKFYLAVMKENDVVVSASPEFLVKPAMLRINRKAIVLATKMSAQTGMIDGENLKGVEKVLALKKHFATDEIKFDSVYTDSFSDFPILDLGDNKYIICKKFTKCVPYRLGEQKPGFLTKIKYFIKQLRMKHYLKNGLILLPLFFSGAITTENVVACLTGFLVFSLIASFVYVINDLFDVKNDRKHPTKRKRPIACYMIKSYEALIFAFALLGASIAICYLSFGFEWQICAIFGAYLLVNLLYSFLLKHIPIVDVFVLALCYVLRVLFGAVIVSVSVSKWFYLTIICASLFMGLGKRRNEQKQSGTSTRKVNKHYNYSFLDKNMYVQFAMTIIFYSMWVVDFKYNIINHLNQVLLLISIPLVIFVLMRYSLDIEKMENNGDPIDVLLNDYVLVLSAIAFASLLTVAIYI